MKRRNILLVVGGISALVMTVCCVLWCCNTRTAESLAELTQQETQRGDFDLSFNYNLGSPSPFTQLLKRGIYDPYTRISGEAPSGVRIYTHDGKLFTEVSQIKVITASPLPMAGLISSQPSVGLLFPSQPCFAASATHCAISSLPTSFTTSKARNPWLSSARCWSWI